MTDLMECQECGMWVRPADHHTLADCLAFIDRETEIGTWTEQYDGSTSNEEGDSVGA